MYARKRHLSPSQLQHKMLTISDIQLQSTSIKYHTCLYQQVFVQFFLPFSSSSPPCLLLHHAPPPPHKVCIRVARDGTINATVPAVGWTQSHLRTCTHCSSRFTWSPLPHALRGQTNTAHNLKDSNSPLFPCSCSQHLTPPGKPQPQPYWAPTLSSSCFSKATPRMPPLRATPFAKCSPRQSASSRYSTTTSSRVFTSSPRVNASARSSSPSAAHSPTPTPTSNRSSYSVTVAMTHASCVRNIHPSTWQRRWPTL